MGRLDGKATTPLTRAAVCYVGRQLDLAAAAVTIAVRVAVITRVELTATCATARAAVLRAAGPLTLAAVLDRIRGDLTAIVRVLIAVAVIIGAANDLTHPLATHGLRVRQLAAVSNSSASNVAIVAAAVTMAVNAARVT